MATQSATSASSSSNISSPPPPPPKESLGRRYKFVWPLLLAVNISIGAYLFTRTNKEEKTEGQEAAAVVTSTTSTIPTASLSHTSTSPPAMPEAVKSIPLDQQRELFKWILEEKRKVKTKDPEKKKQIDEEKAILKHFIRAESIPTF